MNVERCLALLDEAIDAARALGLDASAAMVTRDTARARLGFPSTAYVLALAGGTGVGKSTLLNAIAGETVSSAGARRPTTAEAVAWVPASRGRELAELLRWLGVTEVREHSGGSFGDVAVLDLPDFDSIALDHRERVDGLLPRVDAVAWIVDPQKYMDHVMHAGYLKEYGRRIRRQIVVLNRSDLLSAPDAHRVADDIREQLGRDGLADIEVAATRADVSTTLASSIRGTRSASCVWPAVRGSRRESCSGLETFETPCLYNRPSCACFSKSSR